MKKQIILLASLFLFLGLHVINAQATQQECTIKYNLFKGDYQSKKYDDAFPNWIYLMDNCPTLSINIYKHYLHFKHHQWSYHHQNHPLFSLFLSVHLRFLFLLLTVLECSF